MADEMVTVRRDDLRAALDSIPVAEGHAAVACANLAQALKDAETGPEPPLPPGEYARVEIMGHDYETGWVTDGIRAGVPVLVIRNWDGRVLREVPGQSLYQFVPLATPLKRPEPRQAISGGGYSLDEELDDAGGPF